MGNCRGSVSIGFNGIILIIEFFHENWISLENQELEKRVAITPEIAKKYKFHWDLMFIYQKIMELI